MLAVDSIMGANIRIALEPSQVNTTFISCDGMLIRVRYWFTKVAQFDSASLHVSLIVEAKFTNPLKDIYKLQEVAGWHRPNRS